MEVALSGGCDLTFRLLEKCCDMAMFLLYRPSRDTTVSIPLRNFNVGRCSIRSNATYLEFPFSEGPRMPHAIDRPTCRPNSPKHVEANGGSSVVE
jgi:hypothetical protein